ncbi:MAG: sodium:solute symporter family protein [Myxococcota bacterium]
MDESAFASHSLLFGGALTIYLCLIALLSLVARGRVRDVDDYVVAGRRLSLPLASATLLATWFGAGTLLTAADAVRTEGLRKAALDPLGAGVCLLLAGAFFAAPLWRMRLVTLADFFARRFGPRAEMTSAVFMIPGYFGWIAAQLVALGGMLELFFGIPLSYAIVFVAVVGTGYTLAGGMWSVTLTDALQIALVILGLVVLAVVTLVELGEGDVTRSLERFLAAVPDEKLVVVPIAPPGAFPLWLGAFAAGALGNLPGQDLMQRVFAARSPKTAQLACLVAGAAYLLFGAVPLFLALAGDVLFPSSHHVSVLPLLARMFLHPAVSVVFLLALVSAVLSTIDSAILSPATVLSENLWARVSRENVDPLRRMRTSVLFVAGASVVVAFLGESAYSLLESAYELGLVSLFVPLTVGLVSSRGDERAALWCMASGTALWVVHLVMGWESFFAPWLPDVFPTALSSAACGLIVYLCVGTRRVTIL